MFSNFQHFLVCEPAFLCLSVFSPRMPVAAEMVSHTGCHKRSTWQCECGRWSGYQWIAVRQTSNCCCMQMLRLLEYNTGNHRFVPVFVTRDRLYVSIHGTGCL
jgi:hypothetical protein